MLFSVIRVFCSGVLVVTFMMHRKGPFLSVLYRLLYPVLGLHHPSVLILLTTHLPPVSPHEIHYLTPQGTTPMLAESKITLRGEANPDIPALSLRCMNKKKRIPETSRVAGGGVG